MIQKLILLLIVLQLTLALPRGQYEFNSKIKAKNSLFSHFHKLEDPNKQGIEHTLIDAQVFTNTTSSHPTDRALKSLVDPIWLQPAIIPNAEES